MAVTAQQLDGALGRYARNLQSHGITMEGHKLTLIRGSKTNGISFKLVWVNEEDGGHLGAPGTLCGFLGMTAREAHDRLHTLSLIMEDLKYLSE